MRLEHVGSCHLRRVLHEKGLFAHEPAERRRVEYGFNAPGEAIVEGHTKLLERELYHGVVVCGEEARASGESGRPPLCDKTHHGGCEVKLRGIRFCAKKREHDGLKILSPQESARSVPCLIFRVFSHKRVDCLEPRLALAKCWYRANGESGAEKDVDMCACKGFA